MIDLSTENYLKWKTNILYFLIIINLNKKEVKKLKRRNIRYDIDDYQENRFGRNLVYDKHIFPFDLKNNVMVKRTIINCLGEKTRKRIERHNFK